MESDHVLRSRCARQALMLLPGETPSVSVAPALANALFAATGLRVRSLPLLPDGVLPQVADACPI